MWSLVSHPRLLVDARLRCRLLQYDMQSLIWLKATWLAKNKRMFDKCSTVYSGGADSAILDALILLVAMKL